MRPICRPRSYLERRVVACFLTVGVVLAAAARSEAADPYFDARGFPPNRDVFSELPFEHVDPMTGNVLLTFTDLVLPGNAGFDLRIQRTYNSKIYDIYTKSGGFTLEEDGWAGIGWRLHMGRVLDPNGSNPGPIVEMPDGSRHQLYLHMDRNPYHFITKDYWTFDKTTAIMRLPSGIRYTFARALGGYLWVTQIEDPFGNKIVVNYAAQPAPADAISSISQQLVGGQTRTVTFTFDATLPDPRGDQAAGSLATMTFNSHTWKYTQRLTDIWTYTQLMEVKPPVGPSWKFDYDESNATTLYILDHVDAPNGGKVDYTYWPQLFYIGSGTLYSPALIRRETSGRDVSAGVWTYAYSSSNAKNETVITSPANSSGCDVKMTYTFLGIGPNANQDAWAIGALDKRITAAAGGTIFETEDLTWQASVPISNVSESGNSPQTHVALIGKRDVTRSGRTYSTTYTYDQVPYNASRPNNFNDYGRAHTISETGDSTRTTSRTFFYGSSNDPSFGTYIVDKIQSETVQAPSGGEAFTKSYQYDAATGFKKSETIHGITMTYSPHSSGSGNVGKAKDENNHETEYDYDWAIPDRIETPEYTITRSINNDSTVAWEKRRGFTTSFLYDALSRPLQTKPPTVNPINTSYDNTAGTYVKVTRGSSVVTTSLDGFGRPFATTNGLGIKTKVAYDACGRRTFESYGYTGTPTPIPGKSYQFDPAGRLTETSEPGNNGGSTTVEYTYSQGVDVTIKDEEQRTTKQDWAAFGDPADARLSSVTDAANKTTSYTYNTLGSLKQVTPPSGPARQWVYYGTSETGGSHGQLKSETHPENGTVIYTYHPAGNLKTKTDAGSQLTTLSYDGNNRLTGVDRAGTAYDTQIVYDDSDNRTSLVNGYVSSGFVYDPANRLTTRTDLVNGKSFVTGYTYDDNDNLERITYPSQRKVDYGYDAENRINLVKSSSGKIYANSISYHPSGALDKFTAGNGRVTDFGYNNRYRLKSLDMGSLLTLGYGYDDVGNVTSIDDTRSGFDQGLGYDDLDRLDAVTGFAAGSFGYDSIGNRSSKKIGGNTTTYTYSPSTNHLTSASGAEPDSFGYDANGNMKTSAQRSYTYTPEHMMATATISGTTTTYRYDGDNMRKHKIAASINRYYIHGPGGQILGEYTDSCTSGVRSVRDYVYLGSRLLATIKAAATVSVLATSSVAENAGPAPIGVTVTTSDGCPTDTDITLAYATANGTASAGSDYTATSGTLTIPSGTPSGSGPVINVPITNDTAIEPSETFKLTLSNVLGATLGTATQTVTILDNDTPVVAFVQPTATVGENGVWTTPRPTVRVTTDDGNPLNAAATVKYTTANITAKAGLDYTAQSGSLTFAAGLPSGSSRQISVSILQDSMGEADETFKITLSAPVNAKLGPQTVNTVTIKDDEASVQFLAPTSTVSEAGAWAGRPTVSVVTWDGSPLESAVTVKYTTANITAKAGLDYVSASGFLTFAAGLPSGSTRQVAPRILQDSIVEPNETFKLTLSAPVGGKLGAQKINTITIEDDEPTIAFTAATAKVSEAGVWTPPRPTVAVVTPNGTPLSGTVTVKYLTANITAKAGSDYQTASGTLTFAAGLPSGSSQGIAVTILQDTAAEADETFKITLSAPTGGKLGTPKVNTVTIEDDEPGIAFVAGASSVSESGGAAMVQVRIISRTGAPIEVDAWASFQVVDGTATRGCPQCPNSGDDADYDPTSGTVSFPAGSPSGSTQGITVPIHADDNPEDDETFTVRLTDSSVRLGSPIEHTVTIAANSSDAESVEIERLPFRITKPGRYHLGRSFITGIVDGPAISIEADYVLLDLAGFGIANLMEPANQGIGIHAWNRRNVTIRNGVIRGFHGAIALESDEPSAVGLHRVESILALDSGATALAVQGRGSLVRFNRVVETGAYQSSTNDVVRGIAVSGPDVRVVGNDVNETRGQAIHVALAPGTEVRDNRIGNTDLWPSDGIVVIESTNVASIDNRITRTERGIVFDALSTGRLSGNVMSGVTVPYEGTPGTGVTADEP